MPIDEQHIINEELHPWEIGHETNPIEIDPVVARPTLDLTDQKRDMDYYLEPRKWLNNHNIARTINSGYIDTDQIHGWRPNKLKYRSGTYEDRKDFRTAKQNAKHNKRMLKRAMRYAGSDQQSIADHQFYNDLGERMALIGTSIPAAYLTTGALAAAAYTAPAWVPFVAKNIVLPWLGSEVVNRATNWMTDGKYNSFGDWFYNETPLNEWTEGTWLEEPTRFAADMTNFGYWAPYKKISTSLFHSIPNWMEGKTYGSIGNVVGAQLFKNPSPKALTAAERLTQMVPPQHQASFVHGVEKGNQAMASLYDNLSGTQSTGQWFTTEGMPNPKTTFYSGFPINFKNTFNVTDYIKDFSNKINLYGIIPSHIKSTGFLQPSRKAINDYLNFKKNNPGLNIVYDITPEDVKLRFEDDPEVTQVVDEAHNVVWTKNENGFLINNRPVDIDKVQVLDDVSLNGVDDSWLQNISDTMDPETVMLTGRIKDLRLNGNEVRPWFGGVPLYNYNRSYNTRAEGFLDEAIESASRNKDLELYVESLRNLRNKISNHQFDSWNNVIFSDNSNNISFSTYGNDMRINLPSIVYRNGVWDHPEFMPLARENIDPRNVLELFDRYPFRRTIVDPYHHVYYTRRNGKYYIDGSGWSQPFNPENVSVAPHIDFSQAGRDKLESYLRSVDSPDRIVLTGNVSGAHGAFNLSETPLSRFAPQRVDDHYSMVGISSPELEPSTLGGNVPKDSFKIPMGHINYHKNILHPEFNIPEVDPKLRDNFMNFVESYPGEKLPIDDTKFDNTKLEFLRKIYESFGLGKLSDDIIKKAAVIAEKSATESAAIAPEISLVDQYPKEYELIYHRNGKPVGRLSTTYMNYTDAFGKDFNASHINMIQRLDTDEQKVARSLYSSGLIYDDLFYKQIYPNTGGGLISGEYLLSPEQTIHTILKPNFSTTLFGNYGRHNFNNGRDVKRNGRPFMKVNAPVYHVTGTTDIIPVKSRYILHPHRIEFKDGKFSLIPLDLNNPSLYKSIAPLIGVGAGAAALSESDD